MLRLKKIYLRYFIQKLLADTFDVSIFNITFKKSFYK